jgi:hypothetical protein
MRLLRRPVGVTVLLLSAVGIVCCLAGAVGVWVVRQDRLLGPERMTPPGPESGPNVQRRGGVRAGAAVPAGAGLRPWQPVAQREEHRPCYGIACYPPRWRRWA